MLLRNTFCILLGYIFDDYINICKLPEFPRSSHDNLIWNWMWFFFQCFSRFIYWFGFFFFLGLIEQLILYPLSWNQLMYFIYFKWNRCERVIYSPTYENWALRFFFFHNTNMEKWFIELELRYYSCSTINKKF